MNASSAVHPLLALITAPLMLGILLRTKARFAGRSGPALLQPYRDLVRLARKGAVYSTTTSWAARVAAPFSLAATIAALLLVPAGALPAVVSFRGDFVLIASLLAAARLLTILGALDTGSSFEGLGASREAWVAALAEPGFMLAMAAATVAAGAGSLSDVTAATSPALWSASGHTLVLTIVSLVGLFLAENSRIPVDDPATHLELTMIHEVMILDVSGPDLALFEYQAALKMWVLGAIITGIALPFHPGTPLASWLALLAGMALLAVIVGVVESTLARLRLVRLPQLLIGAASLAVLALLLLE